MKQNALAAVLLALASFGCGRVQNLSRTETVLSASPDALDFGAVTEGQTKQLALKIENTGRSSVPISLALTADSSPDFSLGELPVRVEAGASFILTVTFTPHGNGEDTGTVALATGEATPMLLALHGGAIAGALSFNPDPLDFKPVSGASATKTVNLQSLGTAAVVVSSITIGAAGSQDFALVPPSLPATILPGASFPVTIEYTRSGNTGEGTLDVVSDEPDGGVRHLRLLPDPALPCNGGTRSCYTADAGTLGRGRCKAGTEACLSGLWSGVCENEVTPAATDTCGNHIDDDCDGVVDPGCPVTDACPRAGATTADSYEPNNSDSQSRLVTAPASTVTTLSYDLTLPPGDEDWFQFPIPTTGSNTRLRAEVTCLNWGSAGCGSASPKVGLTLYYMDNTRSTLGLGPSIDGNNTGLSGKAVVENTGPINSAAGNQRWYVQVKPTATVCSGEAVNLTLTVTATNT